jgi:DNA polymerase I-like protein with 3'-5' exonuclease and polymerase domains
MTVLELMEQDNIKGNWTNSTYGKKCESPCPSCGGTNRFHLWPEKEEGGFFWCRQCGKSGNAISYLMHFRGMDYNQAIAVAGITRHRSLRSRKVSANPEIPAHEPKEQSNIQWQHQSAAFLDWSIKCLWKENYIPTRKWLNKERCLKEDTIREANLGWLPNDWYTERKIWGLPEKIKDDGTEAKLLIPAGLVIPCFCNNQLQRLKIRCNNITEGKRYHVLPGSSPIPMILGSGNVFIIVESELDALLLKQEVGDTVGVIALGSAHIRPDEETSHILHHSKKILVSLDSDAAGAKESWQWWINRFPNAIRWPVILGKDPTEAHINNLNLRDWVKVGISFGKRPNPVKAPAIVMKKPDEQSSDGLIANQIEQLKNMPVVSIQIAVSGNDVFRDKITSVALCAPGLTPVLLDLTPPKPEETINSLTELLKSPSEKIFYDAKKTLSFFHMIGIEINGPIYDVMLADKIITAGTGRKDRNLHDVISTYSGAIAGNDLGNISLVDEAAMLLEIKEATIIHLKENNLMDTSTLEFDCIHAVAGMERNGVRVNEKRLLGMLQELSSRQDIVKLSLHEELGDINLNSPKQVKEKLNARGIKINDTKQETILPLITKYSFLSDYLSYKKITYDISLTNNLLSRIDANTGRLHPQYSQIGAPTGRFSCSDPNLQAIPTTEEFRSCFIADDGHKLVIADYSQIELRIVAEISQDQRMIEAYQKGEDLHRLTAALVIGKSITDITKDERSAAKAVNFGLIYAMGAKTLKEYSLNNYGVSMTLQQAKEFRGKFFSAYQGVSKWHQDVQLKAEKETRTLGNRRREWGEGFVNIAELLNTPVQGTSADITKKALCILQNRLQDSRIKIIGCIHDEIITEAPVAETETAVQILRESMIDAGEMYLKNVPVLVDVSVADNWYEK